MKIYFGRKPTKYPKECVVNLDNTFVTFLDISKYDLTKATDCLVKFLETTSKNYVFWTVNPLIMDRLRNTSFFNNAYYIDSTGNEVALSKYDLMYDDYEFCGELVYNPEIFTWSREECHLTKDTQKEKIGESHTEEPNDSIDHVVIMALAHIV